MTPAVAAINHLLAQEAWARAALALHAGKEACVDTGAIALRMRVTADGMLATSSAEAAPAVTIRLKLADLLLIAQNPERAFSYVKIEGDAEFANTISQLSKGLRWEAEYDLERVMGPIAANRLVGGAKSVAAGVLAGHQKLAENMAEFLTEEQPLLIRPVMAEEYASDINRLRDDVERAAKRIARLESRLAQLGAAAPTVGTAGQQTLDL